MKGERRIFNKVEVNRSAQKTSCVSLPCARIFDTLRFSILSSFDCQIKTVCLPFDSL